jgi:hypothetical protein
MGSIAYRRVDGHRQRRLKAVAMKKPRRMPTKTSLGVCP